MDKKQVIIGVLVLVIVAAGSFGAGLLAARHGGRFQSLFGDERLERGQAGMGMMRGGFLAGQVASLTGNTLTLTQPNGSTRTVTLSSSTQIMTFATGTPANLTQGTDVSVSGTANADGSINADTIQIRPLGAGIGIGRTQ